MSFPYPAAYRQGQTTGFQRSPATTAPTAPGATWGFGAAPARPASNDNTPRNSAYRTVIGSVRGGAWGAFKLIWGHPAVRELIIRGSHLYAYSRLPYVASGWSVLSSCSTPALMTFGTGASQLCGIAVDLQSLRQGAVTANPNAGTRSWYGDLSFSVIGQAWRVRRAVTFIRNTGTLLGPRAVMKPRTNPRPRRNPYPEYAPWIPEQVDPWPFPGVPAPEAWPPPYWTIPGIQPNPWRAPSERRQAGNSPNPAPVRGRSWEVWPGTAPTRARPRVRPRPLPRPARNPKPPSKNEKERKVRAVTVAGTAVGSFFSKFTESTDIVNAVWESIPHEKRGCRPNPNPGDVRFAGGRYGTRPGMPYTTGAWICPRKSLKNKMRDIYEHWESIKLSDLAVNLALEQGEDLVFGGIGSIGRDAAQAFGDWTGRPVGFQFGPLF